MQGNIDAAAQLRRKKDARHSAVMVTLFLLAAGGLMLFLRAFYGVTGIWSAVLLLLGLFELGAIVPVWYLLQIRMKEIEGGEEDAAAEY